MMTHAIDREVRHEVPFGDSASTLFAGQFLLGPELPQSLPSWERYALGDGLALTVHPQLPVHTVSQGDRSLTLVGFALDPDLPTADDTDILLHLLERYASIDSLIAATAQLGGRWVLIAQAGDARHLFHDALGLRQAFYTDPRVTTGLWVMSQPGLALEVLNLTPAREALEFIDSFEFRSFAEYRWPAAASPLQELRRLQPNHVLDLHSGKVRRFWPTVPMRRPPIACAIANVTRLLTGLVKAAAHRYDLALALTAGIDSRVVLAASREVSHRISYVTVRQARMADDHPDVVVPARLLNRLGLPGEIVRARASMSPVFSWVYKRSVFLAHDHYGPDAEAILRRFGRRKTVITGSGAEVARCSFRDVYAFARWRRPSARDLARLQQMGEHPLAIRHFGEWLEDARCRDYVPVLDLFEWEQGHGSWLASTQLEFDIAWRDIFTPYNCRAVLSELLGVEERHRRAPRHTLFRRIAETMWPDVLSEPINPGKPKDHARHLFGVWRKRIGWEMRGRLGALWH
ncbi:hypothetical protein SVA_1534 [Sulfurifustis variabilis]|uniref:Asparagine synthetase domain-containing protein n=1 Tax=Sulfurifustis variabilis TaxID=1675686 RepID=A0A1B4V3F9_9GAMM|nr:hypothetical protein [Sulfurifustis variabilis]BAU48096.1 hypothetical protein SVA_1534 [Sulfurifustis variabilis]